MADYLVAYCLAVAGGTTLLGCATYLIDKELERRHSSRLKKEEEQAVSDYIASKRSEQDKPKSDYNDILPAYDLSTTGYDTMAPVYEVPKVTCGLCGRHVPSSNSVTADPHDCHFDIFATNTV